VQDWRGVELLVEGARRRCGLAIVPEVDRGSRIQYGRLPKYWGKTRGWYSAAFGAEAGERFCSYSYKDTTGTPDSGNYSTWAKTSYGYDDDAELTSTTYSSNFADAPASNVSQSYDSNGNRTATNNVAQQSSSDRLLFDGQYYYAYDAAGNRTAKFESCTGALDSTASNITIYQWNNANELTGVSQYADYSNYQLGIPVSGSQVAYGYDAFKQMVSESPVGGTAEYFINDGQNPVLVLNSGGQVLDRELWGPAVDQILATEKVTPLSPGSVQSAGTVNWDLTDKGRRTD
jgi:hypothetical protein